MTVLIQPRQARIFGPFIIALGVVSLAVGVYSLFETSDAPIAHRLIGALFPGLLGALFVVGGRMIAARRGGVEATDDAYVLYGDSRKDLFRIPFERIDRLLALPLEERRGELLHTVWVIEALLRDAPRVLLGESDDEHGLKHVAHEMAKAGRVGTPAFELPDRGPPARPAGHPPAGVSLGTDSMTVRVGLGGSLGPTLLTGGGAMLAVGTLMLWDLANNNVLGFLFGPLMVALGLVLTALVVGKFALVEHLRMERGTLHHHYETFGRFWGRREFPITADAYVRVRQRGLQGACLEVVSDGRILHVGGGVHVGTPLGPPGLVWAGQHLLWLLTTRSKPE